jgi:hypothetical protein
MAGEIAVDWLERHGGAEVVVDHLRTVFPSARITALWNDAPERFPDVRESWLDRIGGSPHLERLPRVEGGPAQEDSSPPPS